MSSETLQIIQLVISGIALPLIGWILREVYAQSNRHAEHSTWREAHDREIVELRTRLIAAETALTRLQIEFARTQYGRANS